MTVRPRGVVVVDFVSLDGVIQAPLSADEDRDGGFPHGGWAPPHIDDTVSDFMRETTTTAAGLLLGRRSYDILAAAWAGADEGEPAVAAMNRVPKFVAARTAPDLGWHNSHWIGPDLPAGARLARDTTDGPLVVLGSGEVVRGLAAHHLVDEYRLVQIPVLLGTGKRLFGNGPGTGSPPARFALTGTVATTSGAVILTYSRPVRTTPPTA